jgi:hypothetical protein
MRAWRMFVLFLVLFACIPLAAPKPGCEGNACDDVEFKYVDGCHVTQNTGGRAVFVSRNNGTSTCRLKPGESCKVLDPFKGTCVQYLSGVNKASYAE